MKLADVAKRILEAAKPIQNIAVGQEFELNGMKYKVTSWDDESVYATDKNNKPVAFLIRTLITKGITFPPIPRKKIDRTGFVSNATIPTRKYESMLKAAVKDMIRDGVDVGHSELYDVATSLIYDEDICAYLSKRYPTLSRKALLARLTTDLEMYV